MAVFFVVKGAMPVYGCTPCILELKKAFRDLVVRSFCVSRFTVNKKAENGRSCGSRAWSAKETKEGLEAINSSRPRSKLRAWRMRNQAMAYGCSSRPRPPSSSAGPRPPRRRQRG